MVSSVDGVGTKLKVAIDAKKHDTIGIDLVNHCVNDIAVLGAEPLFFLDYLGLGKLNANIFDQIISGFVVGCKENNCSLIGGETAQMPGFYKDDEYDVSGTIVGVVEKEKMITGKKIKAGDLVIGIYSNGLHTNGYSLARKILFEKLNYNIKYFVDELGTTVGEELLKPHISYLPVFKKLSSYIKGAAHITGGGLIDNIPRTLPEKYNVEIDTKSWEVPSIFKLLQTGGNIDSEEMYHVFNMGIGMTLIIDNNDCNKVLNSINKLNYDACVIGKVVKGNGMVILV